jgi:hypothetical protein
MEAANVIYKRDQAVCWIFNKAKKQTFVLVFFFEDGFDENSKSILFSQCLVIGQSDSNRNNEVCV